MARRVNTKFLLILTCVVVGVSVVAVVAGLILGKKKPQEFLDAAEAQIAEKNYVDAARNLNQAAVLDPKNPETLVKYGDILHLLTRTDPEQMWRDRAAWERALEADPGYLPALERLLDMHIQIMALEEGRTSTRIDLFRSVKDYADRILAVNPDHARAKTYSVLAPATAILHGVETDAAVIEETRTKLAELAAAETGNADIQFAQARMKLHQAQEFLRYRQVAEAGESIRQAAAVFDVPLQEHPDNPDLSQRAGQLYLTLAGADPDVSKREAHLARARTLLQRASELVQPDHERYEEIRLGYAEFLRRTNDRSAAEAIHRDILLHRPDRQATRIALAKVLAEQGRRNEAIDILSQPIGENEDMIGPRALLLRAQELSTLSELTNFRIDELAATKDSAQSEALLRQINEGYDKIIYLAGEGPDSLQLRGKLLLVQDKPVEAIQFLERARNLRFGPTGPRTQDDYALMYLLARGYLAAQQTGQAKTLLSDLLERFDSFVPARIQLVQLLIRENALEDARAHIEVLEKLAPDNADVQRLKMVAMDPKQRTEDLQKYYESLPEETRLNRLAKAQLAGSLGKADEAIRLLESVRKEDPKDLEATQALVQIHVQMNQKDKALALLQDALSHDPSNEAIHNVIRQLETDDPQQRIQLVEDQIRRIPDEYVRSVRLANLERSRRDFDKSLEHLKKAESIKPNEAEVLDLLFQHYFQQQDWRNATIYADKLAALNHDQAEGALYRFRLAMAQGQIRQATTIAHNLTEKMPGFSQSWFSLGQALQASGQYEEALSKYILAIEKQSENANAFKGIIECYYALQRPNDAKRYIAQARRVFPGDASFAEMEFNHELSFGDPTSVIPAREAAMRQNPELPSNWLTLGMAYFRSAASQMSRNEQASARQFAAKARDTFEKAIEKWPEERLFYSYLADIAILLNEPAAAEDVLTRFKNQPAWIGKPEPTVMLSELYLRTGRVDEAASLLTDSFAKSPSEEVQLKLAMLLVQQQKVDEALKVLEFNADQPRVKRQRLDTLLAAGRYDEAEKALLDELKSNPTSAELLNLLAAAYLNSGRIDDALTRLNDVLLREPTNPRSLYLRGLLQIRRNNTEAAIVDLTTAREQQPGNADIRIALADAFANRNNRENAIQELEAAIRLVPRNKMLRLNLVQLYTGANPPRWTEIDRLFREVDADPAFSTDPEWVNAETTSLMARGELTRALSRARHGLQVAPDNLNLQNTLLNVLHQSKDYKAVVQEADKILAQTKQAWWAYQMRALANKQLGNTDRALADFEAALSSASEQNNGQAIQLVVRGIATEIGVEEALQRVIPHVAADPGWAMLAANLYQQKGDTPSAVNVIETLLNGSQTLNPAQQQNALRVLGTLHLSATPPDAEKSYHAYLRLLEQAPDDLTALNNVACLLAEQMTPPRPRQALEFSQRAYDVIQKRGVLNPLILDTHGWILVLSDRVDEGINVLRQVVERSPFLEAHYHLADAYVRKGYSQDAEAQLNAAKAAIAQAEADQQPVSPVLKAKIAEIEEKLREMIQAKAP